MLDRSCYTGGMKKKRLPRDISQLAKSIVDLTTEECSEEHPPEESCKNPHAVELGRLGGKKGGEARAKKLTPEQRKEIAQKAAEARWRKKI